MRKIRSVFCVMLLALVAAGAAGADTVVVSQVDNSSLLAGQIIRTYVSVTTKNGVSIPGLQKQNFKIYEGPEGKPGMERPILDFIPGANANTGMNLEFLIDNSGSMYADMAGRETANENAWRITYAKRAIEDLLTNIKNPNDRMGVVPFNVKIGTDIPLTDDKATIQNALANIQRPVKEARFTELYESLYYTVGRMSDIRGRKVLILLSDGENFPYKPPRGEAHPQFNERHGLKGALELAQREGISIFTIGIGDGAFNAELRKMSSDTGGNYYNVQNLNQLKGIYSDIQERVLSEYLMTYYAGMEPAERKSVKVVCTLHNNSLSGARSYYSATLFGNPQSPLPFWIFAFLLLAVGLILILWLARFENKKKMASLEVLAVDGKKSRIQPVTIMESQHEVTISGDSDADLTISGDAKLANSEVKLYKEGADYTLMSGQGTVKVNNQPVKAKKLRSGDLITVGNTTIVFDGGFVKRDPTVLLEKTKTSRLKGNTDTNTKGKSTRTPHS